MTPVPKIASRFPRLNVGARAAAFLGALLFAHSAAEGALLVATYGFNNSFNADQGGAPSLTLVDPLGKGSFQTDTVLGQSHSVFRWAPGSGVATSTANETGLSLNTTGLVTPNNYSLEMVFSFDSDGSGFRRVIDVLDRASDNGLYVQGTSHLQAYPNTAGTGANTFTTPTPSSNFHHVALTVASDNTVKGYIDGALDFNVSTAEMNTSNSASLTMTFFLDNLSGGTGQEYANGKIAQLQMYDGVLTPAEVSTLAGSQLVPEPASTALIVAGASMLFGARRRGRRAAAGNS